MAKKLYEEANISDIACAIREKCGDESKTYKTCDMADAIRALSTGGGGGEVVTEATLNDLINRTISGVYDAGLEEINVGDGAFWNCKQLTQYSAPMGGDIGERAFYNCSNLVDVVSDNATRIGDYAFCNCASLSKGRGDNNIYFGHVTRVGSYAFKGCKALTSINLSSATRLLDNAFDGCWSLEKIDAPLVDVGLAYGIGNYCFRGCSSLTTLILRGATVPTLGSYAFTHLVEYPDEGQPIYHYVPITQGTGYIYVPRAMVSQYKAASGWSTYADQIRAIEDYPDICG